MNEIQLLLREMLLKFYPHHLCILRVSRRWLQKSHVSVMRARETKARIVGLVDILWASALKSNPIFFEKVIFSLFDQDRWTPRKLYCMQYTRGFMRPKPSNPKSITYTTASKGLLLIAPCTTVDYLPPITGREKLG